MIKKCISHELASTKLYCSKQQPGKETKIAFVAWELAATRSTLWNTDLYYTVSIIQRSVLIVEPPSGKRRPLYCSPKTDIRRNPLLLNAGAKSSGKKKLFTRQLVGTTRNYKGCGYQLCASDTLYAHAHRAFSGASTVVVGREPHPCQI